MQELLPFVIAIASSTGGLQALTSVVSALPVDFDAPILIVQHSSPVHRSLLVDILSRRTALTVKFAEDKEVMLPKTIYIAPPDWHLVVKADGTLILAQSERQNYVRPAADALFKSLAAVYGRGAIAVVLTGKGSDGAAGVRVVKALGGKVIAQNWASSEAFGMPGAAIDTGTVDYILNIGDITAKLRQLIAGSGE